MTETESTVVRGAAPTTQAPSMGASLRALRVAQGLSAEDVSARIKFSPRQIMALEEERWDELPTGVSLRGLVRNYARLLGADDAGLVDSVAPKAPVQAVRPADLAGRHAPTPVAVDEGGSGGMSWGWMLAIILVIVAGLGYAFQQGWLPAHWLPAGWL